MKTLRITIFVLILLIPALAGARNVFLPDGIGAKADVLEATNDGLWEKTLVVRFPERRRLLSTNAGFLEVPVAANHSAHPVLWAKVAMTMTTEQADGGKIYQEQAREKIARGLGLAAKEVAMMSTAADMDNIAVVTKRYIPFVVAALVTAGAKTNALRAGVDEGLHIEADPDGEKTGKPVDSMPSGTVNIMILTNVRLSDGAMARAIITATEAKAAAFEDLHVPSSYSPDVQATGTGTDSMIVVSGTSSPKVTYTGGHSKIGELIGKAVYEGVIEALGKQNGFKKDRRTGTEPPHG
jgi:adenosylcobinamide amidohydrolase